MSAVEMVQFSGVGEEKIEDSSGNVSLGPSNYIAYMRKVTRTQHVRRGAWIAMLLGLGVVVVSAFSVGLYCGRGTGRCHCPDCWPESYWGDYGWTRGCEMKVKADMIVAPVTALTNSAFLVTGWIQVVLAFEDFAHRGIFSKSPPNALIGNPVFSIYLACINFYCGVASFFFHGTHRRLGHTLDMASVYALILGPLPYAFLRHIKPWRTSAPISFCIVTVLLAAVLVTLPLAGVKFGSSFTTVPIVGVVDFLLALTNPLLINRARVTVEPGAIKVWAVALVLILVAFGFRQSDETTWGCSPTSLYQGHGVWHILAATSVFVWYLFMRSERDLVVCGATTSTADENQV